MATLVVDAIENENSFSKLLTNCITENMAHFI